MILHSWEFGSLDWSLDSPSRLEVEVSQVTPPQDLKTHTNSGTENGQKIGYTIHKAYIEGLSHARTLNEYQ